MGNIRKGRSLWNWSEIALRITGLGTRIYLNTLTGAGCLILCVIEKIKT